MISSMTGYGRGTASVDGREITVELKTVNHRFLDLGMRMPRHLGFLEDVFRKELSCALSRGHVDIYVNYTNTRSDARTVTIDEGLLKMFVVSARKANAALGLQDDLTLTNALRMPDVTTVTEAEENRDAVIELTKEAIALAVGELKTMREQEGQRLFADISARCDAVLSLTEKIALRAPLVVEEYRTKLNERIAQFLNDTEVDRARLATEVALFSDRASIDEEIVRLRSHVTAMREALQAKEPAGRRLDFIVQEMNREFNTIGSKANDAALTGFVLAGKNEIEKIREQIQNVE
ncbi:MAG: YicC family protein [Eubacteriales bacterium]|nr:YicC family protein [Eubacteriales bacterium]